jgi:cation diffusion facilitator family transporter
MVDSGTDDKGPHTRRPLMSSLATRDTSRNAGKLASRNTARLNNDIASAAGSTAPEFVMSGGHGTGADTVHHALRAVVIAMAFNVLIAASKLFVAVYVTRSAALFSEGLHSTADSFNSITLLVGIVQGKKTPDRTHPYGYGLETNFWALVASVVLFLSALTSLWMGWQHWLHPEPLGDLRWALGLLLVSAVFEIGALTSAAQAVLAELGVTSKPSFWALIPSALRNMSKVQSPTTRFVFYEDLVALLGAVIAFGALLLGEVGTRMGWLAAHWVHVPDAVASMIIGVMLLGLSISLFRYNRTFLTGAAASESVEIAIERLVNDTHGVSSIMDLRTINQGISGLFIQMKIQVDPDIAVRDVDDLIDHVKDRLVQNLRNVKDVFIEVVADESDEAWSVVFHRLVEDGLAQDVIGPREAAILRNVVAFTESTAQEVMIPRTDVVSVEVKTPLAQVATLIINSRHSKIPVYRDRVDQLIGVVHARDVFACLLKESTAGSDTVGLLPDSSDVPSPPSEESSVETLASLLKEIDIYPENKPVSDLLDEFKREKMQMAAVLDEHGGFSGIVTAADLMGELVGDDLWDDEDGVESEEEIQRVNDTTLRVSGRLDIYDLNEQFALNVPDDEFQTVGGFVFGLLGCEPEMGDKVEFEDLTFTVEETDGPRIKTVLIQTSVTLGPGGVSLSTPTDGTLTGGGSDTVSGSGGSVEA